mgnify:FL=1
MINPLFSQISTLNPYLQTPLYSKYAVYRFVPLNQAVSNQTIDQESKIGSNLTYSNNVPLTNTTMVGWNLTLSNIYNSFVDMIMIDSVTNHISERLINIDFKNDYTKSVVLDLQLIKNSLFTDISQITVSMAILEANPKNIEWFPILPNTIQLSLLNLSIP